jgi:hypothetical protein
MGLSGLQRGPKCSVDVRHLPRLTLLTLTLLAWVQPGRASADTVTVTSASDHWFTYEEPAVFKVRSYAQQYGIDSMLWLYDSSGNLLAQNDDYFGLDSWLEVEVGSGSYRLRAGVCCGNPDAWYGTSYTLDVNTTPVEPTTTSTTTEPSTTTTSTTSTTTTEPSTTTSSTTSTVPETTTTSEVTTWPPTLPSTTSTSTEPPISEPSTTTTQPAPPPITTTTVTTPPTVPPTSAPETTIPPTTETPPDTSNLPSDSLPTPDPTEPPDDPEPVVTEEITADEATELATDPEALAEATPDQAADIFDAIVPDELTEAEAEAIVAAVQNAPTEIREAFETEINVFDGQFDTYVPLGSTVDVGTRRTVTAGAVTMGVVAVTPTRRKP